MNNARRKKIASIVSQIEELKSELETILDEETEYFENIPENLQSGEKYEKSSSACDELSYAADTLEDILSSLESAAE